MKFDSFRPDMQILRLVGEIDVFKGLWSALSNISSHQLSALKHVATIESVGSSTRIEGATLSDSEVEALLAGLKPKTFRTRDRGKIKMAEIEKLTGESRSTIKLRLNELIDQNKINRHGRGPATWYTLTKIENI